MLSYLTIGRFRPGFAVALTCMFSLSAQTLVIDDERATEGYRIISRLNQNRTRLIDRAGKTVQEWSSECQISTLATLQKDGNLLRTCGMGNKAITAGGASGRIELLDWESNVVWSYELSTDTQVLHHDVKEMPNGNFLMLVWHKRSKAEAIAAGADPEQVGDKGVLFERLIEVRPDYPSGGEIVWQWDLFDHIVQDRFADKPNYGEVSAHPELVNVHYTATDTNPDWFHANAVDYNPALDQIVLSIRNLSEIWIIDHATTTAEAATHAGGARGKGGDLLYRWGNPVVWSAGSDEDRTLGVQHNAHWIEPGLPGEGRMLVFVNEDPANHTESRVVELELPLNADGGYDRPEGQPYGPAAPVWSYESPAPGEFSSAFISGMQRLPNGNTLICSGVQATVFEVNPEGEVLWKWAERGPGDPLSTWVFRANFYAPDYEGLIGTPLYAAPAIAQSASLQRR